MIITQVACYRFSLPLVSPLRLNETTVCRSRDGLLLKLVSDSGTVGWGEAAPLPGFSRESLPETETALQRLITALQNLPIDANKPLIDTLCELSLPEDQLPSVRFAVEQAIAMLVAQMNKRSLRELLADTPNATVPVNGLLAGTPEQIRDRVQSLDRGSYRTVKMKVGRDNVAKEAALVREIHSQLPPEMSLRLDANRAWSFDEATSFCELIRECDIEYIEEPLHDAARLVALTKETGVPVALDETLHGMSAGELGRFHGVSAIVLKPTMLGGITHTLDFVRAAEKIDAQVVISSTFDTGLTVATLAELASAFCNAHTACGLDTLRWLADDIVSPRLKIEHGHFPAIASDDLVTRVNENKLQPV